MKRTHLPLNGLRVLDAAARHLSFTRAANELAVTAAAVGPQSHDYVSGCPLATHHGSMEGHFTMRRADGGLIDVAIPFFPLAAPATAG